MGVTSRRLQSAKEEFKPEKQGFSVRIAEARGLQSAKEEFKRASVLFVVAMLIKTMRVAICQRGI
jgi:hypothetical protein